MIFNSTIAASPSPSISRRRSGRADTVPAKEPKSRDQAFGERFDIPPGHGPKKNEFDKFILGQRVGAAFAEPVAQPLPVAEIMRQRVGHVVLCHTPPGPVIR
jgi:hypothetical protein